MPKLSDFLPQFPWEGLPVPRWLANSKSVLKIDSVIDRQTVSNYWVERILEQ